MGATDRNPWLSRIRADNGRRNAPCGLERNDAGPDKAVHDLRRTIRWDVRWHIRDLCLGPIPVPVALSRAVRRWAWISHLDCLVHGARGSLETPRRRWEAWR